MGGRHLNYLPCILSDNLLGFFRRLLVAFAIRHKLFDGFVELFHDSDQLGENKANVVVFVEQVSVIHGLQSGINRVYFCSEHIQPLLMGLNLVYHIEARPTERTGNASQQDNDYNQQYR